MTKKEIRQEVRQAMLAISLEDRQAYEASLWQDLQAYLSANPIKSIAFFYGFGGELRTPLMIERLMDQFQILLPRIQANYQLSFHPYHRGDVLETAYKGLKQPLADSPQWQANQIDLMIVPGLAFDLSGYRIGYGGGYYDRYLLNFPGKTLSIVYPEQVLPDLSPVMDNYDQKIDRIIVAEILKKKKGEY